MPIASWFLCYGIQHKLCIYGLIEVYGRYQLVNCSWRISSSNYPTLDWFSGNLPRGKFGCCVCVITCVVYNLRRGQRSLTLLGVSCITWAPSLGPGFSNSCLALYTSVHPHVTYLNWQLSQRDARVAFFKCIFLYFFFVSDFFDYLIMFWDFLLLLLFYASGLLLN